MEAMKIFNCLWFPLESMTLNEYEMVTLKQSLINELSNIHFLIWQPMYIHSN